MSRRRVSLIDRFERTLMKGSVLSILALGLATLGVVMTASAVVSVLHIHATDNDLSFADAVWEILQRAIDPGQLANENNWSSRITLLVVTGIGLLLMSTLISIVNTTIESRLENARHGRRPIDIDGHIAIIGWNELGSKYTEELAEAHQDGEHIHAVVLSDNDPVELLSLVHEDLIRQRSLSSSAETVRHPEVWLAARRGMIDNTADLINLARLDTARAAIVLSRDGTDEDVITTVLAIIAALQNPRLGHLEPLTIVASFKDSLKGFRLRDRVETLMGNTSGARLCRLVAITPELIRSGIGSQVARQRGLSELYRDLIDFDGDEIYLIAPDNPDTTFGSYLDLDGATAIGIIRQGVLDLWPSWGDPVDNGHVVVLAHDHLRAAAATSMPNRSVTASWDRPGRTPSTTPEKFLVVGVNSEATVLVRDLRASAPASSTMTLLVDEGTEIQPDLLSLVDDVVTRSRRQDPLDSQDFLSVFEHVLVLSHDDLPDRESDSRVLMDILACRGHTDSRDHDSEPMTVVAELRQRSAKHIAGTRLADDLLVNDSLAASAAVQVAVHPQVWPVLEALLTPGHNVGLASLGRESSRFEGMTVGDVRKDLAGTTGEIPVAIRQVNGIAQVSVNPPLTKIIGPGEELIVLTKHA